MTPESNGNGKKGEDEEEGEGGSKKMVKRGISFKAEDISLEERRDLNRAVKEYLLACAYKMSAMTFMDEVLSLLLQITREGGSYL